MIAFNHYQCPLHRYTFRTEIMRKWTEKYCEGITLNLFAGKTILNISEIRNDIDIEAIADFHQDALEFVKGYKSKVNTVLLDPPYSYRKSMEMYKGNVASPFRQLKDEIYSVLSPNGIVITFGYHSVVMGKERGFKVERIALFSHGGAIHDTIATVERKQKLPKYITNTF